MILVTGANGHLGATVVNSLLTKLPASQIAALVRDDAKGATLKEKGVNIRIGDYNNIESLNQAMTGINVVLLISSMTMDRLKEHQNVVDAAKRAGVTRIAYTGAAIRDVENSPIKSMMLSHFQTEEYIRSSGLSYTFLRNGLYAESIPRYIGENALITGVVFPGGQGKVSFAYRPDLGEAAAAVLAGEGHENKIYTLTGDQLYSFGDIADILSKLSGKTVSYIDIDPDIFENQLKQMALPDMLIMMLKGFAASVKNEDHHVLSNDLETLLGRKPTPLTAFLKAHYLDKA